jgi:hypothetical protein
MLGLDRIAWCFSCPFFPSINFLNICDMPSQHDNLPFSLFCLGLVVEFQKDFPISLSKLMLDYIWEQVRLH